MAIWTNADGLKIKFATEEVSLYNDMGVVGDQYNGDGYFNFKPSNTAKWRLAAGKAMRGAGNATIAMLGDSTSRGQGSGTTTAQAVNGYSFRMANIFQSHGFNGNSANIFGTGTYTLSNFDSRFAATGAYDSSTLCMGGPVIRLYTTNTVTFTPGVTFDRIDIYTANNNTGQFTVNVDGGSTLATINSTSSFTVTKTTVTGTGTAINLVYVSGNSYVVGIDVYENAKSYVKVWNWGWGGATAANWASTATTFGGSNGIRTYFPADLYVINLGINDWEAGVNPDTYAADIQTIITACKTNGDVALMTPLRTGGIRAEKDQWEYVKRLFKLAQFNDIPVFDVWNRNGTYTQANALGYMTDTKHPVGAFYTDTSRYIVNKLLAV